MREAAVEVVAVDLAQVHVARAAFRRFGKGRDAAGLNFGDCFADALAKVRDQQLLFTGDDVTRTEVSPAFWPHGAATGRAHAVPVARLSLRS